jgi:hypothetical protein
MSMAMSSCWGAPGVNLVSIGEDGTVHIVGDAVANFAGGFDHALFAVPRHRGVMALLMTSSTHAT